MRLQVSAWLQASAVKGPVHSRSKQARTSSSNVTAAGPSSSEGVTRRAYAKRQKAAQWRSSSPVWGSGRSAKAASSSRAFAALRAYGCSELAQAIFNRTGEALSLETDRLHQALALTLQRENAGAVLRRILAAEGHLETQVLPNP